MPIYLYRNNQQDGPYEESVIHEWLQKGQLSPDDPAIREGMTEWQPLRTLFAATSTQSSGKLDGEFKLYQMYSDELENLFIQMAEADDRTAKQLSRQFEQKLQILEKQSFSVKQQFPDTVEAKIMEAGIYYFQAKSKIGSRSGFRKAAQGSYALGNKNSLTRVAIRAASSAVASQQEKNRANEALALLQKSITIFDLAQVRFAKAVIHNMIGDKSQAIQELNYIIANFQDEEDIYFSARQLKDEIENPPKKGMCFIATAAYGSTFAPELTIFYRFRDEVLLKSKIGARFVDLYYVFAPPIASLISKAEILKLATRFFLLTPMLKVAKFKLKK